MPRAGRPRSRLDHGRGHAEARAGRQCREREQRFTQEHSLDAQGFDAGRNVLGRKRHVLIDTLGLLLNLDVHSAQVQDRDGIDTLVR